MGDLVRKYYIIIIVVAISLLTGAGTGYYAHDCGETEPQTVLVGLDGTVPVEVTCECKCETEACEVDINVQEQKQEGPCPPPLEFKPAKWSIGAAAGQSIFSGQFDYRINPRWSSYIEAVYITDWPEIQKQDYKWYNEPTISSTTEARYLIGVRYSPKPKLASTTSTSP